MRALGVLTLFLIVIGALLTVGVIVLAFLGIRAALNEEKNRRLRKAAPEAARADGGVPLFNARRREES